MDVFIGCTACSFPDLLQLSYDCQVSMTSPSYFARNYTAICMVDTKIMLGVSRAISKIFVPGGTFSRRVQILRDRCTTNTQCAVLCSS